MQWQFGPYRLDPDNACLWHGEKRLTLRPKTFELLSYLVEHADQLVSKETLMDAIWPGTVVVEGVLTTGIGELRKLFGETAKEPQFIATEHRRGYRFIAPVTALEPSAPALSKGTEETRSAPSKTPFIGRQQALKELRRLLVDEPQCRLLTLVGPGGIGKTRLAGAVAEQLQDEPSAIQLFSDGIFFVPLQSLHTADNIPVAIAEIFSYRFHGSKSTREQLLAYLQKKRILLILDNFEHLQEGTALIASIYAEAPYLKLLITSRVVLELQEAWVHHVEGMVYPVSFEGSEQSLADYDAYRLFEHCARRNGKNLCLDTDRYHVLQICQLVEGMPLALELAAGWLKVLSPQEIAHEIEKNLDILTAQYNNVPERHRSLRAVLTQTWQSLTSEEQVLIRNLSVFRGGCERNAAEQVAGANLSLLAALVDRSLLRYTDRRRYELHELIRQFAGEALAAKPYEYEQIRRNHSHYYADFLNAREESIKRDRQLEVIRDIGTELDNIRLAWQWAVNRGEVDILERSAECLRLYSEYQGTLAEWEAACEKAAASLFKISNENPQHTKSILAVLLATQGYLLCRRAGDPHQAVSLARKGLSIVQQIAPRDQHKEATVGMLLGFTLMYQADAEAAQSAGERSRALFADIGDHWGEAQCILLIGMSAFENGNIAKAKPLFESCIRIYNEAGESIEKGYAVRDLAIIALLQGDYRESQRLLEIELEERRRLNDLLGIVGTLLRLGQVAIACGNFTQAIQSIQESILIRESFGEWGLQFTHIPLGVAYRLQGDYSKSRQFLNYCLTAAKTNNHQPDMAASLCQLGCLALCENNHEQAEKNFTEALDFWVQLGNELEIAKSACWLGLALSNAANSRCSEAWQYFKCSLELAEKHELAPLALDICTGVAQLLKNDRKINLAVDLLIFVRDHTAISAETRVRTVHILNTLPVAMTRRHNACTAEQNLWNIAKTFIHKRLPDAGQ